MTDSSYTPGDSSGIPDPPVLSPDEKAQASGKNTAKTGMLGGLRSYLGERFSSPMARCVFIGIITLCLLFPLGLVKDVVYDRMHLYSEATNNITDSWGREQTVNGPALIIPYQVWIDSKELVAVTVNGKNEHEKKPEKELKEVVTRKYVTQYMVILPSELSFDASLDTEVRYRGIYKQALYTAPMTISGGFILPTEKDFGSNLSRVFWNSAWLCVGVSDLKSIAHTAPLSWAGITIDAYKPGTQADELLGPGFRAEVFLAEKDAGTKKSFSMQMTIRGSGGIFFTPVGENTAIKVKSAWPSPNFQGSLLPVERSISDQGFSANWLISNLTRTYPQMGDLDTGYTRKNSDKSSITAFTAGVNLHEPVTLYRMVRRSLDYGILFISVTFVALFVFEMVSRRRMRMLQYAMVGLSMSLFYLVLLSLAEHISFGLAFVAASVVTVAMNSLYVGAVLQSRAKGLLMGGLLSSLYAVLFSLLRMEDSSLLMGTGLVLVMMGALMFVTRKLPQVEVKA
ncbi:MAG: cell envelope integrity protein CreD [Syntrophorhabdaceae bacterium]|nr:cell envelope integrity protein CreD [Syntrophorhabdaceae bacterium]